MNTRWRVIDTGELDPFSNMAFDETLLRSYEHHSSPPTLRIYGWNTPAISIGYSQDPDEVLDTELCRKARVPFVRRITGGGVILHGNELTYSLVCSKGDLSIPARVVSSYKIISSFLIAFYDMLNIKASFACDIPARETLGEPSASCFAAKEKYDIVSNGRKIGGSAQKRRHDLVFQHGSIPINFDKGLVSSFLRVKGESNADSAVCLEDILGRRVTAKDLSQILIKSFVKRFNIMADISGLSETEEKIFNELKVSKYESDDWNIRRIDRTINGSPCDPAVMAE